MSNQKFSGIFLLSDVDGTLIDLDKNLPKRNVDAIEYFVNNGGTFTLASGRNPKSIERFLDRIKINAPAVALNGVIIYDFDKQQIIKEHILPKSYLDFIKLIYDKFPTLAIHAYVGSDLYSARSNKIVDNATLGEGLSYDAVDINDFPAKVNKVLFGDKPEVIKEVIKFVKGKLPEGIYGVSSEDIYYEILPEGANKGTAAEFIARQIEIPKENTAAVGDYYNDIEMLKKVGLPMATHNAPDEVKMFARYITRSCAIGAVADAIDFLEKHFIE